jgi:hypothetical protein
MANNLTVVTTWRRPARSTRLHIAALTDHAQGNRRRPGDRRATPATFSLLDDSARCVSGSVPSGDAEPSGR